MTLDEMLARDAIRATISRYNSAIDRGAYAELVTVFTSDGVMALGDRIRLEGLDTIIGRMTAGAEGRGAYDGVNFQRHVLGQPHIELIDADHARTVTYLMLLSEQCVDHTGLYIDDFVRTDGDWRIRLRTGYLEWGHPQSRFTATLPPGGPPLDDLDVRGGDGRRVAR